MMVVLSNDRPKGREAAILLKYEKTDISGQIAQDIESFSYICKELY